MSSHKSASHARGGARVGADGGRKGQKQELEEEEEEVEGIERGGSQREKQE